MPIQEILRDTVGQSTSENGSKNRIGPTSLTMLSETNDADGLEIEVMPAG